MKLLSILFFMLAFVSCGSNDDAEYYVAPAPNPQGDKVSAFWKDEMKPLVDEACVACHSTSSFVASAKGWINSNAKARVSNGTMPPPNSSQATNLSDNERAILILFPDNV